MIVVALGVVGCAEPQPPPTVALPPPPAAPVVERRDDPPPLAPSSEPQPASDDVKDRAKKAYIDGMKAFGEARFKEAARAFELADELYPGAAPKFRAAECYDQLGLHERAAAAYEKFLASDPGPKYADRVQKAEARLQALRGTGP